MQAVEFGAGHGVASLHLVQRADEPLAPHQIRVRVRAVSLNYRDLLVANGVDRWKPPLGRIPTSDGAGEVVEVGTAVTQWRPGDRVVGLFLPHWTGGRIKAESLQRSPGGARFDGFLADNRVLGEGEVTSFPDYLSYEEAATLPCAALTAWHGLVEEGQVRPGHTVLIQGTGGVSLFSLQFALQAGARVIVLSSSDAKLDRVRALGAHHTLNYARTPDWAPLVRELTDGRGVDHVVEVVGGNNINKSLDAVAVGGTISVIGIIDGLMGEIRTEQIMGGHVRLQGIEVGSTEMFQRMNQALATSQLRPIIDRIFSFAAYREAYDYLSSGGHFGKICISLP
ncbi:NAD(P)-dependent alcohol dehydrogenase [Hymenobacter sp. BT664]|uniref:NAD(P)-dependent alcohol dehydrogenase n=1 Tax=Hymenobacter montanus TaxID=2771359 RepID=A0A927BC68_9BACT|nr:NAD(P)-dependent alcohol dehydrogenase [Hymenobacter montanus]MBD2767402.1 NAD(P)-dependent alcohol dehydrogenase [Hymenobacter montanus]